MINQKQLFAKTVIDLLDCGNTIRFQAPGHSMHPTIRHGEMIIVQPARADAIRRSDIILSHGHRDFLAHRVIAIEYAGRKTGASERSRVHFLSRFLRAQDASVVSGFRTRGDSSDSTDDLIDTDKLLGKVVAVQRGKRRVELVGRRSKLIYILRRCAARFKRALREQLRPETQEQD